MNRVRHKDRLWTRLAVPVVSMLVVVGVWLILVHGVGVASYVLPSPTDTLHAISADWDVLSAGIVTTAEEFLLGFLLGTATGFLLAVVMAQSRWVLRALYPILIASQAVPIIAIGAALVIWMGFGLTPKVAIVALIVFFPVVVNVLDGLASVDEDAVNLARAMGGGTLRTFRTVRLPATYTPLFSALKMSATFSVTGAVIGEQSASSTGGLGVYLTQQQSRLNTAGVFGDIVLLAAMGILAFALIAWLETLATPWRRHSSAPRWSLYLRARRDGSQRRAPAASHHPTAEAQPASTSGRTT
jgi:ABC-type nitrate/sulfonate/bicarbonate transport system permease component